MNTAIYVHDNITVRTCKTNWIKFIFQRIINLNTVSQATLGYLLFTVQHLCYLLDAMACQRSPALPTQPYYCEYYRFERVFFTLRCFLPCTPSYYFQGFSGSWQCNLKVSGLFVWITAIHKRFMLVGSI